MFYMFVIFCISFLSFIYFLHAVIQAYNVEQRSGRPGPDESDLLHVATKRLGATFNIMLVRALLGLIGHTTDS